eukprot:567108_1
MHTFTIIGRASLLGWVIVSTCILSPLTIYLFRKFDANKSISYFHARRPKFIWIMLINLIYYQVIHVPVYIIFALYVFPNTNPITYCTVTMTWFTAGFHGVILLFHVRGWLLCYDLLYNSAISDIEWHDALLSDSRSNNARTRSPFVIRYRDTIGKRKPLLVFWIISTFVISLVSFMSCSMNETHGSHPYASVNIIMIFVQILCFCSSIVIVKTLYNSAEDQIDLRKCLIRELSVQVVGIIGTIGGALQNYMQNFSCEYSILGVLQWSIVPSLCFYIVMYMILGLPLYYYKNRQILQNMIPHGSLTDTLDKVLCDKYGLKLLARHLVKEYSIENLLFLMETNHWKQVCVVRCKNMELSVDQMWRDIYVKYVNSSTASWEINISASNRKNNRMIYYKLKGKSNSNDDIDVKEMNKAFNDTVEDVRKNLFSSLTRLRNTIEFIQWEVNINSNSATN